MRILLADAIEEVIRAAKRAFPSQSERDACEFLEEFVRNDLGLDEFDPASIDEAQDR